MLAVSLSSLNKFTCPATFLLSYLDKRTEHGTKFLLKNKKEKKKKQQTNNIRVMSTKHKYTAVTYYIVPAGPEWIFRCLFFDRVWYTLCASASSRQLKFRPDARAVRVRLSATAKVQPYHVRATTSVCSGKCRLHSYFSIITRTVKIVEYNVNYLNKNY